MKYAVILNGDLNDPHLKIYLNELGEKGISPDVIFWDRTGAFKSSEFAFASKSVVTDSSIKRLVQYFAFSFYIKRIIRKNNYDKLVVISPQVALFMPFFLKRKYKKKYIFDYRDLSIEQNSIFKPFFKIVLKNSYANMISSPGFKEYLPKEFHYVLSHNFTIKNLRAAILEQPEPIAPGLVKLLTIGAIRFDANYSIIDSLGNKENIELDFVGKGDAAPVLQNYANTKCYKNIKFEGQYRKEEESGIIKNHSMINIFYPNWPSHISALSNRFYNSLMYKRPMLVTKGSVQGNYVEKYGVGLAVENCDNLSDKIIKYLNDLDFNDYSERCNKLLHRFEADYVIFKNVFDKFLDS